MLSAKLPVPKSWTWGEKGKSQQPTDKPEPNMLDWSEMVEHYGQRSRRPALPVGWNSDGQIELVDLAEEPHLLIVGKTGMGKTDSFMRPVSAYAAMRGWQVIILDKSGRNYKILNQHPNVHVLTYTPESLPAVVQSIYEEIVRRDKWLNENGTRKYANVPDDERPSRILLIVDECANALSKIETAGVLEK